MLFCDEKQVVLVCGGGGGDDDGTVLVRRSRMQKPFLFRCYDEDEISARMRETMNVVGCKDFCDMHGDSPSGHKP